MSSAIEQFSEAKRTPAEEAILARRIKEGDEDALNALVMGNMREALKYSQRVSYDRIDEQTRVSLCYQEMMMSGRRFIPGGIRFFAFAKAGLRGRMKTYWTSLNTVRNAGEILSVDAMTPNARGQVRAWPSLSGSTAPPDYNDWDSEKLDSAREAATGEIEQPNIDQFVDKDHWQTIRRELSDKLSDQEWMILDLTYVSGLNFPQIGKLVGLTRSRIHAIHRNAIKKLRAAIGKDKRLLL